MNDQMTAFQIIKTVFCFRKTRYKGEKKNAALMHILYASVNLVKLSRLTKGAVCQKAFMTEVIGTKRF